ncbi:MAG: Uma2 family endonuclease [Acidobacteriia bacterium]|nr:Uma2 family endonuclease [Terriglobia bacterium]
MGFLTEAEYLARERQAEHKSEYFGGEIFAMFGARRTHVRLTGRIWRRLLEQLDGRDCEAYAADLRVRTGSTGLYTYPGVVVVCGEQKFLDKELDTLLNPTLVLEILSPSTEAYDRGRKFEQYRGIESLREYVLVDQQSPSIECFLLQPDGGWLLHAHTGLDAVARLESIDCQLALRDVYDGVLAAI